MEKMISKKFDQRKKSQYDSRARMHEILMKDFPQCFAAPPQVKPLAIGIRQALFNYYTINPAAGVSKTLIRMTLRWYTSSMAYLIAVKTQTHRIDVQGCPATEITAAEKQDAAEKLNLRCQSIKAKKASETVLIIDKGARQANGRS